MIELIVLNLQSYHHCISEVQCVRMVILEWRTADRQQILVRIRMYRHNKNQVYGHSTFQLSLLP